MATKKGRSGPLKAWHDGVRRDAPSCFWRSIPDRGAQEPALAPESVCGGRTSVTGLVRGTSLTAPAINYLDVYLHGIPVGVVGIQTIVEDLIHPGDHDFLYEPCDLFGLILGALDDQLVMHDEDQSSARAIG